MLYKFVKLKYMRKKTSEFVENVIKKKDCGAKKTVLATFNLFYNKATILLFFLMEKYVLLDSL